MAHDQPSVHWREGMFLRPQHLQAFSRELGSRIFGGDSAGRPSPAGIRRMVIDEEALGRDVFRIVDAEILFGDGSLASIPKNATVEAGEFGEHLKGGTLQVHLGIASFAPNVPVVNGTTEHFGRYAVEVQDVHDENIADSSKPLELRKLQARLFFGSQDRTGFECLPVAQIVREGRPVLESRLSSSFIPPIVATGGSPVVMEMVASSVELLRAQARDLAGTVPGMKVLTVSERGADISGLVKLQAVNAALAPLEQVRGQADFDPAVALLALVQAVGHLSVFSDDRMVPSLPAYDWQNPTLAFGATFEALKKLVAVMPAAPYDTLPFQPDPMQTGVYQCELDERWLTGTTTYYLGVEIAIDPHRIADLVSNGVKICSPRDKNQILKQVIPGIRLDHVRRPPVSFPERPDLHYFLIDTEGSSRTFWVNVMEERKAVVLSTLGALGDVTFHFYVEHKE